MSTLHIILSNHSAKGLSVMQDKKLLGIFCEITHWLYFTKFQQKPYRGISVLQNNVGKNPKSSNFSL